MDLLNFFPMDLQLAFLEFWTLSFEVTRFGICITTAIGRWDVTGLGCALKTRLVWTATRASLCLPLSSSSHMTLCSSAPPPYLHSCVPLPPLVLLIRSFHLLRFFSKFQFFVTVPFIPYKCCTIKRGEHSPPLLEILLKIFCSWHAPPSPLPRDWKLLFYPFLATIIPYSPVNKCIWCFCKKTYPYYQVLKRFLKNITHTIQIHT